MKRAWRFFGIGAAWLATCVAGPAQAGVGMSVTVSVTGFAASPDEPAKNTVAWRSIEIAGRWGRSSALDAVQAVKTSRPLIDSTFTPNALAMIDVVAGASIVEPLDVERAWAFKPQRSDRPMEVDAIAGRLAMHGLRTAASIAFSDAYEAGRFKALGSAVAARPHLEVANGSFARSAAAVNGQERTMLTGHPAALPTMSIGTLTALAGQARDNTVAIHQTHDIANQDLPRACGNDRDSTCLPARPILVADPLSDIHPVKPSVLAYKPASEPMQGSTFEHAREARRSPHEAITVGRRHAPRDVAGVFTLNTTDRARLDGRARAIVEIPGSQRMLALN